jgi:hypothetical protein
VQKKFTNKLKIIISAKCNEKIVNGNIDLTIYNDFVTELRNNLNQFVHAVTTLIYPKKWQEKFLTNTLSIFQLFYFI